MSHCKLDQHTFDITTLECSDDGTYALCISCGATLIADGPYIVTEQHRIIDDRTGDGAPIALAYDAATAQRIAGLLNLAHKDGS